MRLSHAFIATVTALPLTVMVSAPARAHATRAAAPAQAVGAAEPRPRPHVYLVPHQDDEVLSMAATIRRSIRVVGAENVHIVLMTTGESSGARTALARGFYPRGDLDTFVQRSLTPAEFSASRDAEFLSSVSKLGVRSTNAHLSLPRWKRVADEKLTTTVSSKFVNAVIDRFGPNATYHTMSDADPHIDHRVVGIEMRKIAARRKVAQTVFHYPSYQLPAPRALVRVAPADNADRAAIRAAARQYGVVNPKAGRWSIGWLSVPAAFGKEALTTWQQRPLALWKPGAHQAPRVALLDSLSSYTHR